MLSALRREDDPGLAPALLAAGECTAAPPPRRRVWPRVCGVLCTAAEIGAGVILLLALALVLS